MAVLETASLDPKLFPLDHSILNELRKAKNESDL
jgi:hypothetical protein